MQCPVCLQQQTNTLQLHPCGHSLCRGCLHTWCKTQHDDNKEPTCPVCRTTIEDAHGNSEPTPIYTIDAFLEKSIGRYNTWCESDTGPRKEPHQVEGVEWCLRREHAILAKQPSLFRTQKVCKGGLICDEMGLGKTIQVIGLIISNFLERTLIVLPPALVDQWIHAFKTFCGHTPLLYHGPKRHLVSKDVLQSAPIVITTYHTLAAEHRVQKKNPDFQPPIATLSWNRLVMDEAHHLRNRNSLFDAAMMLVTDLVWLVTGTPVHNREIDLDAYWYMLRLPKDLIQTLYTSSRHTLRRLFREAVLRRTKAEVGIELPALTEEVINVNCDDHFEQDFAEQLHSQLGFSGLVRDRISGASNFLTGNVLPALVRCRQACVRPELMDTHIQAYREMVGDHEIPNAPKTSAKLDAVVDHMVQRRDMGRKIAFCHYLGEIDSLSNRLTQRGFTVGSIDGRVPRAVRTQYIIDPLGPDVLLVQINSGSEGLNMQAYSDLYVVSPHWNPSVDDQAIARAHRIGQSHPVHVSRFLSSHPHSLSLDQHAHNVQLLKRRIRPF